MLNVNVVGLLKPLASSLAWELTGCIVRKGLPIDEQTYLLLPIGTTLRRRLKAELTACTRRLSRAFRRATSWGGLSRCGTCLYVALETRVFFARGFPLFLGNLFLPLTSDPRSVVGRLPLHGLGSRSLWSVVSPSSSNRSLFQQVTFISSDPLEAFSSQQLVMISLTIDSLSWKVEDFHEQGSIVDICREDCSFVKARDADHVIMLLVLLYELSVLWPQLQDGGALGMWLIWIELFPLPNIHGDSRDKLSSRFVIVPWSNSDHQNILTFFLFSGNIF